MVRRYPNYPALSLQIRPTPENREVDLLQANIYIRPAWLILIYGELDNLR